MHKRIAILGAGAAGLGAAWLLSRQHRVTVYERERTQEGQPRPGGHARTVTVKAASGQSLAIDMGVILMRPDIYPNLFQLFGALGVTTNEIPIDIAVSFDRDGHQWGTGRGYRPTAFFRSIEEQARDFEAEIHALFLAITTGLPPRFDPTKPVKEFLEARAYSSEFINKVYCPMTSFLLVTRGGMRRPGLSADVLLHCPLGTIALLFGTEAVSFFKATPWHTLAGGTQRYVRALWAEVEPRLERVCAGARSIRRVGERVEVTSEAGTITYDEVVIATPAEDTVRLLADIDASERSLLTAFEYEPATVYLHTDESVLSPHLGRDTFAEYSYGGSRVGPWLNGVMTYNMTKALGLEDDRTWLVSVYAGEPSMLPEAPHRASFREHATPAPEAVAAKQTWDHIIWNTTAYMASAAMKGLQGRRHTWFCGSHAHLPAHEDAFVSGLVVAGALGAQYPFTKHEGDAYTPWFARYADMSAWMLGTEPANPSYFPLAPIGYR